MSHLSFEELSAEAARYDEAVIRTPTIDHFCSSSLWILPAIQHFSPASRPFVFRSRDTYLTFAHTRYSDGTRVVHPLEAMWALASPLAGGNPAELVELLVRSLTDDDSWDIALISGIGDRSELWQKLVPELSRRFSLSRGSATRRYIARLASGVDGFLANRSTGFRKNLRKAEKRARGAGLRFENADNPDNPDNVEAGEVDASFDRLLTIERRSWKGQRGVGIDGDPMGSFYRAMNRRLVERGARRLLFATLDGADVAYIFGGLFGDTYRGLQFSFDHRHADLSLGNLCQLEQIRRLCDEGVPNYDLGTEVRYKKRWGDRVFTTSSFFVQS